MSSVISLSGVAAALWLGPAREHQGRALAPLPGVQSRRASPGRVVGKGHGRARGRAFLGCRLLVPVLSSPEQLLVRRRPALSPTPPPALPPAPPADVTVCVFQRAVVAPGPAGNGGRCTEMLRRRRQDGWVGAGQAPSPSPASPGRRAGGGSAGDLWDVGTVPVDLCKLPDGSQELTADWSFFTSLCGLTTALCGVSFNSPSFSL